MTETTTLRGALIMPYPSAFGPADEPLTIEWPSGLPSPNPLIPGQNSNYRKEVTLLDSLRRALVPPVLALVLRCRRAAQRGRPGGPIQGYEAMHMIRKGPARWVNGSDDRQQIQFINKLFEVAA